MMGFRFRPHLGLSYERQGMIYFTGRNYDRLSNRGKVKIERLCHDCGGEHWRALFELVTTDRGIVAVSKECFVSERALYRALCMYYRAFYRAREGK